MFSKDRRIVLLASTKLLQSDIDRYALDELLEMGYHIATLDASQIVDKEAFDRIPAAGLHDERIESELVQSYQELDEYLKNHRRDYYFLMFDYYYEVRKIYDLLTKYDVDYGNITTALTDSAFTSDDYGHGVKDFDFGRLSVDKWKRIWFNRIVRRIGLHKPANFQLIGGKYHMDQVWKNCCCKKGVTRQILIRSYDYERFLRAKPYDNNGKPYAVFLDQYMPYHPDFKDYSIWKIHIPEKEYFEQMHDILDVIRNRYGMEVIIAGHPRGSYEDHPDVWKGCKVVYGKSAELAKNASLIMTHFSQAITFSAMAHKPAMLLNIPLWDQSLHFTGSCRLWGEMLGAPVIRYGADLHETFDYQVNEERYASFKQDFTQSRDADERRFWEIAMDEIEG